MAKYMKITEELNDLDQDNLAQKTDKQKQKELHTKKVQYNTDDRSPP
jgi:hypothetical protein